MHKHGCFGQTMSDNLQLVNANFGRYNVWNLNLWPSDTPTSIDWFSSDVNKKHDACFFKLYNFAFVVFSLRALTMRLYRFNSLIHFKSGKPRTLQEFRSFRWTREKKKMWQKVVSQQRQYQTMKCFQKVCHFFCVCGLEMVCKAVLNTIISIKRCARTHLISSKHNRWHSMFL